MAPEQDQPAAAESSAEEQLTEERSQASLLERALVLEKESGVDLVDQAANKSLQRGLDNAKLALLPLFYFYLPLLAIFIIIMAEFALDLRRRSWHMPLWRKIVYTLYSILFLFLTITVLGGIGYAYAKPKEFCELVLDGTWAAAVPGAKQVTCSVYGGVFNLLKPS